jgi:hypothetical protein
VVAPAGQIARVLINSGGSIVNVSSSGGMGSGAYIRAFEQ